nr:MAG TPA: hypothetical protein [Microviridae sp.]
MSNLWKSDRHKFLGETITFLRRISGLSLPKHISLV